MTEVILVIVVITLLIFIERFINLSKRINQLADELSKIRNKISATEAPKTDIVQATDANEISKESVPVHPAQVFKKEMQPATPAVAQKSVSMPQTKKKHSKGKAEWEALIGEKLLNRIGAVALVIALGFFLKYAFDNDWITEAMRVIIGGLVGSGLIITAYYLRKKQLHVFAQGILGAGISILYLSVYAAFNYYQLISQPIAFILMSLVTVLAFIQGLSANSLAVAGLAWLGGFLTPFLLSTGEANETGLFSYITLLDIGILALIIKRNSWIILNPLSVIASYFVFLLWYDEYFVPEKIIISAVFLTVFWFMFFALDVFWILRRPEKEDEYRLVSSLINIAFYFVLLHRMINDLYHEWMGLITILLACVYILTFLVLKRFAAGHKSAGLQLEISAIVLIVSAFYIQFSDYNLVIVLSLFTCLMYWWSVRENNLVVSRLSLALLIISLIQFIFTRGFFEYDPLDQFVALLNIRALAFGLLLMTIALVIYLLQKTAEKYQPAVINFLLYLWCTVLFYMLSIEVIDYHKLVILQNNTLAENYVHDRQFLTLAVIWIVYALGILWYGLKAQKMALINSSLLALLLSVLQVAIRGFLQYNPLENFTILFNIRSVAMIMVLLGCLVYLRWMRKNKQVLTWTSDLLIILHITIVLLVFDLLTSETRDYFGQLIMQKPADADMLANMQQLLLSGVWLFYSIILMGAGIWRRNFEIRVSAIVLSGITILKIFIYDLSFLNALNRIISFFALGLILLLLSYLYTRFKQIIFERIT